MPRTILAGHATLLDSPDSVNRPLRLHVRAADLISVVPSTCRHRTGRTAQRAGARTPVTTRKRQRRWRPYRVVFPHLKRITEIRLSSEDQIYEPESSRPGSVDREVR
jgi:hypothetical protein